MTGTSTLNLPFLLHLITIARLAATLKNKLLPLVEMRADAGLHADPKRRQIGESGLLLATRPFLPQHDGTALILANEVERGLADIDADYGGRRGCGLCHNLGAI